MLNQSGWGKESLEDAPGKDFVKVRNRELCLSVKHVSKMYGSVRALDDVSLELEAGKIYGLVGDNGAGKSTLVRILAGADSPTSGAVWIEGKKMVHSNPRWAREQGVEVVYQDLALGLDLDVADNVFLGREIIKKNKLGRMLGWLDRKEMRRLSEDILDQLQVRLPDIKTPVRRLSGGQRQGIAVARAASWVTKLLILDEPTAALGVEQQENVARMIQYVADKGSSVLLVSHNMPQVIRICETVFVLRRGSIAAKLSDKELTLDNLVAYITGSKVNV